MEAHEGTATEEAVLATAAETAAETVASQPAGQGTDGVEESDPAPVQPAEGVLATGDEPASGAGRLLTDDEILQSVTALIYASPEPLSEKRMALLLEDPEVERIRLALDRLAAHLAESGLPLRLVAIAGGWQILTAPSLGDIVQRLFKAQKSERVSPAALETLAVIAYRQPVTKAEIEAIRGVQAAPILRSLIDRGLVRATGRADVPGHPLQYGTTKAFLDRFGLPSLEDLPRDSELSKD